MSGNTVAGDEMSGDGVTVAVITIGDNTTAIGIAGLAVYEIPRGMVSLHRAHVTADPPLPENLTNAIGDMMDHVDDAVRVLPSLALATTTIIVGGAAAEAIAAVELGAEVAADTFELARHAAEDVFRTLATEAKDQRRRNPGLPADLVETIPAGCCALVAILRSLHLDRVTVRINSATVHAGPQTAGTAGRTTAAGG